MIHGKTRPGRAKSGLNNQSDFWGNAVYECGSAAVTLGKEIRFNDLSGLTMSKKRTHTRLEAALLEGIPTFVAMHKKGVTRKQIEAAFQTWGAGVKSNLLRRVLHKLVHHPVIGLAGRKPPLKPGRPPTTKKLADFAEAHRGKLSRRAIADLWNRKHPNCDPVDEEDVRGAWRRAYGDKSVRANH